MDQWQYSGILWGIFYNQIILIFSLGDRHCDNILLCSKTGTVVHVDYSCLFEKVFLEI